MTERVGDIVLAAKGIVAKAGRLARLYDGTLAADYYRAMGQVERLLEMPATRSIPVSTPAGLVALLDSLGSGTLNEQQRETVQALREGILALAMREPAPV